MNIKQFDLRRIREDLRPIKDLVAFTWRKPKLKSGLILPDKIYDMNLKSSKYYTGKVIAVGPGVREVKPHDIILIAEYGIKDFRGGWKEDEIYFIEEKFCLAKLEGADITTDIKRILPKKLERDENKP